MAEFTGLQEVLKKMADIKDAAIKGKIANKALVKAGQIIRDEAKRRAYTAPADYEVWYDGKKITLSRGYVGDSVVIVKMSNDELKGLSSGYLVTLGRGPQDIKGVAKKMGALLEYSSNTATGAPMPFMGPAYDAKSDEAFQAAEKEIVTAMRDIWM